MIVSLDWQAWQAYNEYMQRRHTVQYTIRNVSSALDRALRESARRKGKSLNEAALEALAKGAGLNTSPNAYGDLDRFFGSWVEDSAVDQALAEQRTIEESIWR